MGLWFAYTWTYEPTDDEDDNNELNMETTENADEMRLNNFIISWLWPDQRRGVWCPLLFLLEGELWGLRLLIMWQKS